MPTTTPLTAAPGPSSSVTEQDIDLWLAAVPRMARGSPRRAWYVRAYGVIEKIRRAKRDGTFAAIVAQA